MFEIITAKTRHVKCKEGITAHLHFFPICMIRIGFVERHCLDIGETVLKKKKRILNGLANKNEEKNLFSYMNGAFKLFSRTFTQQSQHDKL